jgi:hypothetical protein
MPLMKPTLVGQMVIAFAVLAIATARGYGEATKGDRNDSKRDAWCF